MSRSWMQSQLVQSHLPSRPPPPIASASGPRSSTKTPAPSQQDPLTTITRQARALEHDLQTYLDAQADGLLAELRGERVATPSDEGSLSASKRSASSRVLPVRQPRSQPMSLGQARRGMWNAMRSLSTLKATESSILSNAMAEDEHTLAKIDAWLEKRVTLERETEAVRAGSQGERASELKEEDAALGDEISKIEARLAELKSQQRAVRHELTNLENGVQAKLSSYRESAHLLERDIDVFLKRPPSELPGLIAEHGHDKQRQGHETYLNLPPKRRTLDMAKEYVSSERELAESRLKTVMSELQALEEGSSLWNDAAGGIAQFERALRQQIKSLGAQSNGLAADEQGRDDVLGLLDETIHSLQDKLRLAETKGWNLLVVAIGSELEAFQQGRIHLREALLGETPPPHGESAALSAGSPDNEYHPPRLGEEVESETEEAQEPPAASPVLRSAVLDPPRQTTAHAPPPPHIDEEPDPELLISQ